MKPIRRKTQVSEKGRLSIIFSDISFHTLLADLHLPPSSCPIKILQPLCFRRHMEQILLCKGGEITPLPSKVRFLARGWREQGEWLTWTGDQNSSQLIVPKTYQMTSRPAKSWRKSGAEEKKSNSHERPARLPCTLLLSSKTIFSKPPSLQLTGRFPPSQGCCPPRTKGFKAPQ